MINKVFIVLGEGCNLNCKYCSQHPFNDHIVKPTYINPKMYDFIMGLAKDKTDFSIRLYGGEPLLYYNNLKEVVLELKERGYKGRFLVITNGMLLTDEMIDFFNENNILLRVSWDGRASEFTRGVDVMKHKKDIILKANRLKLNMVLTSASKPSEMLEDAYNLFTEWPNVENEGMDVGIRAFYNTSNTPSVLDITDLEGLSKDIQMLLDKFNNGTATKLERCYIKMLSTCLSEDSVEYGRFCSCGESFTINTNGNLVFCSNSTDVVGDASETPKRVQSRIASKDNYFSNNQCKDCEVLGYCRMGCNYLKKESLQDYCNVMKALCKPILDEYAEEECNEL